MKTIELIKQNHDFKIGEPCKSIEPNIKEDCYFVEDGKIIGFYLTKISDKAIQYIDIANNEFLSKNVPKTMMSRGPQGSKIDKEKRLAQGKILVEQYSTILGGIAPKPHMRRNYASISYVHTIQSAQTFIKSMLLLLNEVSGILLDIMPEQYEIQKKLLSQVNEKYRLNDLFTSSISNANIAASYHQDLANIKNTVNIIITKRYNSTGGCLNVPDYGATIEQKNNSILVYPAWKNLHGVTPIIKQHPLGYRNSFVFYPIAGLINCN